MVVIKLNKIVCIVVKTTFYYSFSSYNFCRCNMNPFDEEIEFLKKKLSTDDIYAFAVGELASSAYLLNFISKHFAGKFNELLRQNLQIKMIFHNQAMLLTAFEAKDASPLKIDLLRLKDILFPKNLENK